MAFLKPTSGLCVDCKGVKCPSFYVSLHQTKGQPRGASIFVTGISFECGVSISSLTGMEVPVNKMLSMSTQLDVFQSSLELFAHRTLL